MSKSPRSASSLVAFSLALVLLGCGTKGSGVAVTETREVDEFTGIESSGALDLKVHVGGDARKVVVSGDDNIVPRVVTKVRGDKLVVETEDEFLRPELPLLIEIWVPELVGIEASGASDVDVEGLHGEQFELDLSGAADADLRGKVDRLDIDISGAADVDASSLEAATVLVDLSGAGEAKVWVTQKLDVDVSGAGNVAYWGHPTDVRKDISGAGSVQQKD